MPLLSTLHFRVKLATVTHLIINLRMAMQIKPILHVGHVIRYGWLLYKAAFSQMFLVAFLAALLGQLLLISDPAVLLMNVDSEKLNLSGSAIAVFIAIWVIVQLCHVALLTLLQAAHQRQRLLLTTVLSLAIKKLLPVLVASSVFGVLLALGLALWVFPGVLVATLLVVYMPLILFDNARPFDALSRSFKWVSPFFLSALSLTLLILLLLSLPSLFSMLIAPYADQSVLLSIDRVAYIVLSGFALPLADSIMMALYLALRAYHQNVLKS